ncbi:MAG TPA: hypothetical protein VIJ07_04750, partial [Dermatophilaceae bacterium]
MGGVGQVNADGWDRRRLLLVLACVIAAATLLLLGLACAVYFALTSATRTAKPVPANAAALPVPGSQATRGAARRDQIASAPMLAVGPADSRASTPAARAGPTITIPASTRQGLASVPAGFPRTPEGAVAQLAAIETTVLQGMSIAAANQVYEQWALPGGVGVAGWEITQDVQAFLTTAQMGTEKDMTSSVVATPAASQVKGTDGPGWVLACVLLDMRATITADAAMGYGYCERMQWSAGRWMIGSGTPPARAPSTWP